MRRTLKSSKAPSSRPTRRYSVTPAMQEDRMLRDAVRRAEESARDRRRDVGTRKRRQESQVLKARVVKEKERKKIEENKKIMQQQREEQETDQTNSSETCFRKKIDA